MTLSRLYRDIAKPIAETITILNEQGFINNFEFFAQAIDELLHRPRGKPQIIRDNDYTSLAKIDPSLARQLLEGGKLALALSQGQQQSLLTPGEADNTAHATQFATVGLYVAMSIQPNDIVALFARFITSAP